MHKEDSMNERKNKRIKKKKSNALRLICIFHPQTKIYRDFYPENNNNNNNANDANSYHNYILPI